MISLRPFQAEIMRVLTIAGLIMIATTVFGQGGQQPSATPPELTPAQREAREELNLTAAEYRRGHFADAQQHAERALALDPSNRTAFVFLARVIHQQYKPGIDTPANIETARAAITAYQRILAFESDNEEAFKAVAVLYSQIHEEKALSNWILQRALNPSIPAHKRAEAYAILAGRYWDCSYKITDLNKRAQKNGGSTIIVFVRPKSEPDFEKLKRCVSSGLQMADNALAFDPNLENAWTYKSVLLMEQAKLAEMDGQYEAKASFLKAAEEARAQASKAVDKRRQESPGSEESEQAVVNVEAPSPPEKITDITDSLSGTIISGGALDDAALDKPLPSYPAIAKSAHASGTVIVEVVVDESGKVIRARVVSGHPLLQASALVAAREAKFSPSFLDGQPAKVRGFLTYDFSQ